MKFDAFVEKISKKFDVSEKLAFELIAKIKNNIEDPTESKIEELIRIYLAKQDVIHSDIELGFQKESPLNRVDGRGIDRSTRGQVGDGEFYIGKELYDEKQIVKDK